VKDRVLAVLRDGKRFLLTAHRSPDGDAIGSLLGMWHALRATGREACPWLPDGVGEIYAFLPGAGDVVRVRPDGARWDATIVFDCGDPQLLPDGMPGADEAGPLVAIDHHGTYKDFGDVVLRRPASAVGEIVYDLLRELGWPIDAGCATNLYTAVVTDTGSFAYATTTGGVLRMAADLVDCGADPWLVSSNVFERWPRERLALLQETLGTLSITAGGRVASLEVTAEMMARTHATPEMLEGFVNQGRRLRGVEVAVLVSPAEDGQSVRVSLRSQGRVDVAAVALRFGGGGHRAAAGCRMPGPVSAARALLVAALERAVTEAGA